MVKRGMNYLVLGFVIILSMAFASAFTIHATGAQCGTLTAQETAQIYATNGGDNCEPITKDYPYFSGICGGSIGCFGITDKTTCESWSECSWSGMCCKSAGKPEDCPSGTTFDPVCVGTYDKQVTGYRCEGEYVTCDGSGGLYEPLRIFFAVITGNPVLEKDCGPEDLQEPVMCYGSTELECERLNPACYWSRYTYTSSGDCSKLSDSSCESYDGCLLRGDCIDGCKEESECGVLGVCSGGTSPDCSGTFTISPAACKSTGTNNGLIACDYFQSSSGCRSDAPSACKSKNCASGTTVLQGDVCPFLTNSQCVSAIPFCGWYSEGDCNVYDNDPTSCISQGCNYLSGSVGTCEQNGCYNEDDCGDNELCSGGTDGYCSGTPKVQEACNPKAGASDKYTCKDFYAGFEIMGTMTDACTFAYMLQEWLPQVCVDSKCTDTTQRTMNVANYCSNFEEYPFGDPTFGKSCGVGLADRCEWTAATSMKCSDFNSNPQGCEFIDGCSYTAGKAGSCVTSCIPSTEICTDNKDNDCDGLVDCSDTDCKTNSACIVCTPSTEICTDGKDNDCDGKVDCSDSDCSANSACVVCTPSTEVCNGKDDDCDNQVDEGDVCKKNTCEKCVSNTDCKSGICAQALDSSNRYCASSNNCVVDSAGSCEKPLGYDSCSVVGVATCSSGNSWLTSETCSNGCSNGACVILPEEVRWKDKSDSRVVSSLIFERSIQNQVLASVKYPKESSTSIKIMESDSSNGEDGSDDEIADVVLRINENGDLSFLWEITEYHLSLADEESDNIYEFYYEYAGKKAFLNVEKEETMIRCENGVKDDGELGVDCGGVCGTVDCCGFSPSGDGVKICDVEAGENSETCRSDCPLAKEAMWAVASPIELAIDDLRDKENLSMQLFNYDPQDSLEFVVEEDETNSEVKRSQGSDVESVLVSNIQISLDDLEKVKRRDSDKDFQLFFNSQNTKSSILEILVSEDIPECGNGICEWGELDMVCGDTDCFTDATTCEGYNQSEELCLNDPNNLADNIPGDCLFTEGECRSGLQVTIDGVDIGTCLYIEDESLDDCSDGFLSYSWDATWNWSKDNKYDKEDVCGKNGFFCDPDELYARYDPRGSKEECVPGQATVPCPAQVQLSFFTWINLILAIVLVATIYYIMKRRKNRRE